jgi:hypothetical protein
LGNFFKENIHQYDFYHAILLHFVTQKSSKLLILAGVALFYPYAGEFSPERIVEKGGR